MTLSAVTSTRTLLANINLLISLETVVHCFCSPCQGRSSNPQMPSTNQYLCPLVDSHSRISPCFSTVPLDKQLILSFARFHRLSSASTRCRRPPRLCQMAPWLQSHLMRHDRILMPKKKRGRDLPIRTSCSAGEPQAIPTSHHKKTSSARCIFPSAPLIRFYPIHQVGT